MQDSIKSLSNDSKRGEGGYKVELLSIWSLQHGHLTEYACCIVLQQQPEQMMRSQNSCTGLLTIPRQIGQVSFLVKELLRNCGSGSSDGRGGGVIDSIYLITALGVSPQCLPLCWLADLLLCPPPLEISWKCKQIYN